MRVFILVLVLIGLVGCASPASTPTPLPAPSPTPTPTLSERRGDIAKYLAAYNQASNNADDTMNAALAPLTSGADWNKWDAAATSLLRVVSGYEQQIKDLKPPQHTVKALLLQGKFESFTGELTRTVTAMQAATRARDENGLQASALRLGAMAIEPATKEIDALIQQLLEEFNIPDSEVQYRRPNN